MSWVAEAALVPEDDLPIALDVFAKDYYGAADKGLQAVMMVEPEDSSRPINKTGGYFHAHVVDAAWRAEALAYAADHALTFAEMRTATGSLLLRIRKAKPRAPKDTRALARQLQASAPAPGKARARYFVHQPIYRHTAVCELAARALRIGLEHVAEEDRRPSITSWLRAAITDSHSSLFEDLGDVHERNPHMT